MQSSKIKSIVLASLFAALTCVVTMYPQIPIAATNGYVHMGDTLVLISAWLLGPVYGSLAAGVGSALADLISGYAHYVPGTFVIKFLIAFTASVCFKALSNVHFNRTLGYTVSGILGELFMVLGYFLYSWLLLGNGAAAAISSVPSNLGQGAFGVVAGVLIIRLLVINKTVVSFFPGVANKSGVNEAQPQ